jgi:hypothetical protein
LPLGRGIGPPVRGDGFALGIGPIPDSGATGRTLARGAVVRLGALTNLWSGQQAVVLAEMVAGPDRAESLGYRFTCENLLAAMALEQPIFG